MDQPFEFKSESEKAIVYVRPVSVADLPKELRSKIDGLTRMYSVHDKDGQRLALVADRALAFALARQYDFSPVNVH
jgi:hypothetical protein